MSVRLVQSEPVALHIAMLEIVPETPEHLKDVEALHRAAFGADEGVDRLVVALRAQSGAFDTISLVAHQGGKIVGHVMACSGWIDDPTRLHDVMILSPLGVLPSNQRQGIGRALIEALCTRATLVGCPLMFLEGSPSYYPGSGFEVGAKHGFKRPSNRIPEPAFQVRILAEREKLPTGRLVYPDVFWQCDAVGLR